MKLARPAHLEVPTAIRIGRVWLFSDGSRLPVIAGAAEGDDDGAVFEVPPDLTTISDDELAALETQAVDLFDGLNENPTAENLPTMSELSAAILAIRAEGERRVEAAEAVAAEAAALAEAIHGPGDGNDGEGEGGDGEGEGGTPDAAGAEGQAAAAGETVTAAAPTPAPARTRHRIPLPLADARTTNPRIPDGNQAGRLTVTAASDILGVQPGSVLPDGRAIVAAMNARAMHMPIERKGATSDGKIAATKVPVASFTRPSSTSLEMNPDDPFASERAMVASATVAGRSRENVDPAALVAAGGWCAPSETLYDFYNIAATDGLIDIPSAPVVRGGVRWPVSPSIADAFAAPWLWTEQNDIDAVVIDPEDALEANPTKPCVRIPCPSYSDEERLDAHGVCLTNGNLADRAFPEASANFIDLVMAAHEHLMSYRKIAAMVAGSTAHSPTALAAYGAFNNVMGSIALERQDLIDKYRMAEASTLEVVLPTWILPMLREDLARRLGVDLTAVTRQTILADFALRGVAAQFVQDWQALNTGPDAVAGADGMSEAWPATVKYLIYPAGTWQLGNGPSITQGVLRDSILNATNDHTAVWTEETFLIAKRGHESRVVTVPVGASGATADGLDWTLPSV